MKKLLGILVLGYRIMWDNYKQTTNKRDKARKELLVFHQHSFGSILVFFILKLRTINPL
jgi:hypothetical protein